MAVIKKEDYFLSNGTAISIRNAESKDAEELININLKIIDEIFFMLRSPGEAVYTTEGEKQKIINCLKAEGSLYIVAEISGKVVGYLDFSNGSLYRTKHAGSFSVYILKEFRQIGIGKMLLKTLIQWAEINPLIEKLTLAVFSTNEIAHSVYKKMGFIEEGRCPKDMKLEDGTYMDSVLMYRFV